MEVEEKVKEDTESHAGSVEFKYSIVRDSGTSQKIPAVWLKCYIKPALTLERLRRQINKRIKISSPRAKDYNKLRR